jgi:signal transduction histidine kinase
VVSITMRAADHGNLVDVLGQLVLELVHDRSRAAWVWTELEAGRPIVQTQVSPELIAAIARTDEQRRALQAVTPCSWIVTGLVANGRLVGVMAWLSSSALRVFAPADFAFAEQVGQRVALAIDSTLLYRSLRRAIQSRDDVLGVVAHDLRNPLGTILMQAELCRSVGAVPVGAAEHIERSALRMSRIIQDLLDVTRIEQGVLSVDRDRIAADTIVRDAAHAHEPLASAASVRLAVSLERPLPEVWADRERVLQILENLIGNAIKFTPRGGSITIGAAPHGDNAVVFCVADTGSGIPPEDLPHVFDRFWHTRARGRGAGLGLAIAKGLVEAHRGRIWVDSTPGAGTTFSFTIPTSRPQ